MYIYYVHIHIYIYDTYCVHVGELPGLIDILKRQFEEATRRLQARR